MRKTFNIPLQDLPNSASSPGGFTPYNQDAIRRGDENTPKVRAPTMASDTMSRSSVSKSLGSSLLLSSIFKKAECRALVLFLSFLLLFYLALETLLEITIPLDFVFFGTLDINAVRELSLDKNTGTLNLQIEESGTYFAVSRSDFNATTGHFEVDVSLVLDLDGVPERYLTDGTSAGVSDLVWMVSAEQLGTHYSLYNLAWFDNKAATSYVGYSKIDTLLELETDTVIDFVRMIGSGSFVQLEEDKSYVATIFDDSLENEDVSAFASSFCTQDGVVLARGTNATDRDFSSRVFFTPSATDTYVLRTRSSGLLTADNSNISAHISVKEILPIDISLETSSFTSTSNDLKASSSTTYEINLLAEMEYLFEISSEVTVPNSLVEKLSLETENSRVLLPQYFPGVGVTLYNKVDNLVIDTFSSTVLFQNVSNILNGTVQESFISIEAEGPLEISFIPSEDLTVLLDVVTLNPNYLLGDPDFVIGTFNISVDAPGSAAPIESGPLLADPNAPFSTCESTGLDLVIAGCNRGVYLYCQQIVFPFENVDEIPVEAADAICFCASSVCSVVPADNITNSFFQPIKIGFYVIFAIIGVIGIFFATYALLELALYEDFRVHTIKQHNLYVWFLCYAAFVMHTTNAIFILRTNQLASYFTNLLNSWEQKTGHTDPDFYGVDPFQEITQSEQYTYEQVPLFDEKALEAFNEVPEEEIQKLSTALFTLRILLIGIALLLFADGWITVVSASSGSTYIKKQKHMERIRRRVFYIRVFQVLVISAGLAYPISWAFNLGEGYSPNFFVVTASFCFILAAILLFKREKSRWLISAVMKTSTDSIGLEENNELKRVQILMRETSIGIFFSAILVGISCVYLAVNLRTIADFSFNKVNAVYEMFEIYINFGSLFAAIVMYRYLHINHQHLKKNYIMSVMRELSDFRSKPEYSSTMAGEPSLKLTRGGSRTELSQYLQVHQSLGLGLALFGNPAISRSVVLDRREDINNRRNEVKKLAANLQHSMPQPYRPKSPYFITDSEIDRTL